MDTCSLLILDRNMCTRSRYELFYKLKPMIKTCQRTQFNNRDVIAVWMRSMMINPRSKDQPCEMRLVIYISAIVILWSSTRFGVVYVIFFIIFFRFKFRDIGLFKWCRWLEPGKIWRCSFACLKPWWGEHSGKVQGRYGSICDGEIAPVSSEGIVDGYCVSTRREEVQLPSEPLIEIPVGTIYASVGITKN